MNLLGHEKILKAMRLSDKKHAGQKRKGSGIDYFIHPVMTAFILVQFKRSEKIVDLICAMLLHDVIEDTDATYEELLREFGPLVVSIVQELCNDDDKIAKVGKLEYQKKKVVGISNYALLGKLADRLHNILDQPKPAYVGDTIELIDYLMSKRKLTSSQLELAGAILDACKDFRSRAA